MPYVDPNDSTLRAMLTYDRVGAVCRLHDHVFLSRRAGDVDYSSAVFIEWVGFVTALIVDADEHVVTPVIVAEGLKKIDPPNAIHSVARCVLGAKVYEDPEVHNLCVPFSALLP